MSPLFKTQELQIKILGSLLPCVHGGVLFDSGFRFPLFSAVCHLFPIETIVLTFPFLVISKG